MSIVKALFFGREEGGRLTSNISSVNSKLPSLDTKMVQNLTKFTINYKEFPSNNFVSLNCNCSTALT